MEYKLIDINESYTELATEDIQFKKKVIDTLSVYEEGYQFMPAFRAGIYDGKKKFYTIEGNSNIRFLKGLVPYIIKDLQAHNYQYSYETSTKETDIVFEDFEKFVKTLNIPFEPYDYQMTSAFNMIKFKRGIMKAATGSGKSLILYIFLRWMLENKKKCLLVVPTISLTLQMRDDFIDYGLKDSDNIIKLIGGEYNNKDLMTHPLTISTWQSLYQMNSEQFEPFEAIAIDESHLAKADALKQIISNASNAQWKLGLTGTVPRTQVDKLQLLGTLGRVFNVITPQGLIDRGLATPVFINLLYFNYSQIDRETVKKEKMKYQDEDKFLCEHFSRNEKVASLMNKIINMNSGENVLALFTKIDHGKLILKNAIRMKTGNSNFELLDKITPKPLNVAIDLWELSKKTFYINQTLTLKDKEKIIKTAKKRLNTDDANAFLSSIVSLTDLDIYFIYGGVGGEARESIRRILEEKTRVQIIASYSTTSTGVNFKNLHHIVLASSTKSFIRLSQTVGRGMRKHSSKDSVQIWDIIDDLSWETKRTKKENYALKHSYERVEIYRENGYPLKEKEINL